LRYGVDLLDLYRGSLTLRRVCALADDAAVWRTAGPDAGWSRSELVLAVLERRVTLLWATVAATLGQKITDADLTGPLDAATTRPTSTPAAAGVEPETKSLREIALWMRGA
jgi:hypothetical protein